MVILPKASTVMLGICCVLPYVAAVTPDVARVLAMVLTRSTVSFRSARADAGLSPPESRFVVDGFVYEVGQVIAIPYYTAELSNI